MVHRSNLLNWLKTRIDNISREDESDHVHVECSLIRCISEYREKELLQIKVDKDFNTRLLNRLEHIDLEVVENYSDGREKKYRMPLVFSGGFALAAVIVSVAVFYSGDSPDPEFGKFPAHVTPIHLNENSYSGMHIEQEALLDDLKKSPENVRLLEKLETYYFEHGKKEQATEIHTMLETVSKKY